MDGRFVRDGCRGAEDVRKRGGWMDFPCCRDMFPEGKDVGVQRVPAFRAGEELTHRKPPLWTHSKNKEEAECKFISPPTWERSSNTHSNAFARDGIEWVFEGGIQNKRAPRAGVISVSILT